MGEIWHCRRVAREELLRSIEKNMMRHPQCMLTNCVGMTSTIPKSCKLHNFRTSWQGWMILNRFVASEALLSSDTLRRTLSTRYVIPDHFWTDACQRSNGFFGCQDTYDEERKLKTHSIDITIIQSTRALAYSRPQPHGSDSW